MLTPHRDDLAASSAWDFSDLVALYVNCTLKRSPEMSHTQGLLELSASIMRANDVAVEEVRAVDHHIATGVWPDMREHGWHADEWPEIDERVQAADILVIGTPIWLGEKSSVCTRIIERLYGNSSQLNAAGQYAYYGKVGGCLVTGNEDGIKHCSMSSSTPSSTSATSSRRRRTRVGSARQGPVHRTSIPAPEARRTTSPIATRRS